VFENRYNGVLEGWKVLLIRARARRLKFRGQDLDEAVQEVALALIDFRFDSAHPSQASEQTAIITITDRRLISLRRKQMSYQRHVLPDESPYGEDCEPVREPALLLRSNIDLSDVDDAVRALPDNMRAVAELLMDGRSLHQVAQQLCMSWNRARRIARDLQQHFQKLELGTPRRRASKPAPSKASPRRTRDKESCHVC
jgi:RNA polymerase sigma factor (sigma-70 family)